MKRYIALVHQDEGSAYGIQFPDLPGCFSASDTEDELISNAQEALSLYLEGEDAPEPRPLSEVKNNPAVREELARGAILISVPLISLEGRTQRANITKDAGLLRTIDEAAKERNLTRSSFIADLARRDLEIA